MEQRGGVKWFVALIAVAGIFVLIAVVRSRSAVPREFRGTLRYPVVHIGGEGSSAILATKQGTYDLFFAPGPDLLLLTALDGKRVVVVGHSRTAHGIERKAYSAIDVIDLRADRVAPGPE